LFGAIIVKLFFLLVFLIVVLVAFMAYRNLSVPAGLGVTDGKLAEVPSSPNAVSSQTGEAGKRVDPLPFKGSLSESKARLLGVLQGYGGIEIVKDDGAYIHAVATTAGMRFKDDLEFAFNEQAAIIDVRSASRVGYSDGGLNRERYEALRKAYLAE